MSDRTPVRVRRKESPLMVTLTIDSAQLLVEVVDEVGDLRPAEAAAVEDARWRIGRAIRRQYPR
jgi:hypothetical protein